ncbi:MAG: NAD(P)/FAD-dependent oxidoreductase [Alphaproteobacteria bacterium]|nr:NAD(P)/FAD-dependent oxidoreductase [Alphaproteobacteria bacterium]
MTDHVETVVIGAGVVGLAIARTLALAGQEVVILDRAEDFGTETSSRHSEVIHAGIYYPTGSLKARACVAGKHLLYDYMDSRGIAYSRLGKLIVATDDSQIPALAQIKERAEANGVPDLEWLDPDQVRAREPAISCVTALWSPSTGILDSHGLMASLLGEAEDHGAMLALFTPVLGGSVTNRGFEIETGGEAPMRLSCTNLVLAAGHGAQPLAAKIAGIPADRVPAHHYCKGSYYSLTGVKPPFSTLIYPAPEQAGLGVHATLDLAGQCRFGPDTEWLADKEELVATDYDVDPARAETFYAAVRKYWPGLPDDSLAPGYAGIRPKIQAPGEPAHDFVIQGAEDHGVPGLVALYGIESPGVTSSLALADHVHDLLKG